mmetsp:Transcript_48414/g.121210  ORF Transcript_48414/g.121210 Transcript_48414/m.121210 type:complete len:106 (-) Transcript_48414:1117-1434(-)
MNRWHEGVRPAHALHKQMSRHCLQTGLPPIDSFRRHAIDCTPERLNRGTDDGHDVDESTGARPALCGKLRMCPSNPPSRIHPIHPPQPSIHPNIENRTPPGHAHK